MLEIDQLRKRYGNVAALDGCSFTAAPGRMVGFLGPNGSGKTTTMRSIFGLVHLDSGEVRWRGAPVGPEARRRFGYMPEERGLYGRSRVGDQVRYFARLHGSSAHAAAEETGRWLERLGLEDREQSRVEELSHGNQQRVQLMVALVHEPDVIVLDEPFSGLDPVGVDSLGEMLRAEAARGAAVVFSSHQLDLVQSLCDDVAVIDHGRVVLHGDLDEVRAASAHRYVEASVAPSNGGSSMWPPRDGGVGQVWQRGHEVRLRVDRGTDPGPLLTLASQAGTVEYFRFEPPSLSDLFMEAVRR